MYTSASNNKYDAISVLSIRAPYLVDVESMRPRLQSRDVSSNGHWALRTSLGHDKVPTDLGVLAAAHDTHGGDRSPELAALIEAFLRWALRPDERDSKSGLARERII